MGRIDEVGRELFRWMAPGGVVTELSQLIVAKK